MTSQPDSTPRRRPPTIDLTATEVGEETAASAPDGATAGAEGVQEAGTRGGGRTARGFGALRPQAAHAVGAIAGAAAIIAVLAAFWWAGMIPARDSPPRSATPDAAAAPAKELSARLDKIEAALAAQRPDASLATRITAAEAEAKALDNSTSALIRRVDGIAVTVGNAQARADAAEAAADAAKSTAQTAVQRAEFDAVTNRLAALERAVRALSDEVARRPASADDRPARLSVAAEALRAAVERGIPYEAELAAVKSFGLEETTLAPLEPFAATGLPVTATLAHELAALGPALLQASGEAPREHSFLDQLQANVQKLVRISPIDAPRGNNAPAAVQRIEAAAERGDLSAALAELARLPDDARAPARNWIERAQAREAALAACRRIAADALAALRKPASQ